MKKKLFGFVVFVSLLLSACQKDDICPEATATTPMLIIRFYDFNDPSELKPVQGLNLIAEGSVDSLFTTERTVDSIAIPLKTFQNTTEYQFIKNVGDEGENELPVNSDQLNFSYFPNEEFVSKACGFRVEFLDFLATRVSETGSGNWIKNIVVQQTSLNDQTRAHLFIFH